MADPPADHGMEVANEQVANTRYLRILERKADSQQPIAVARSSLWTGSGLPLHTGPVVGPVVGRVGLDQDDDLIGGASFYIGPWHADEDGLVVFSWAAPVAAAFYGRDGEHDLVDSVLVRRTMQVNGVTRSVEDFFDEWDSAEPAESPFTPAAPLTVPRPPIAAPAPRPAPPTSSPSPTSSEPVEPHAPQVPAAAPPPPAKPTSGPRKTRVKPLRAADAVKAALAAPRGTSLPTLLGTLQPDQYDFVTRPLAPPLVIQGHPGTGKTVIAAHRAAYLVHPERGEQNSTLRVLIVGPNDHYAAHVKGVLDSLTVDRDRVVAMGLMQVLARLRRMDYQLSGPVDGVHYDVDNELSYIIEAAAVELKASAGARTARSTEEAAELVYDAIRTNQVDGTPLTEDRDLITYLKSLPRWKVAVTQRRYLPIVTQCSVSAVPPTARGFDHVIVDEAQDVRPLEWRLLTSLNRQRSWTILGDMNQRRSDWTYHSWNHLGADLDICDESGKLAPAIFTRGYRSTEPIIKYANHLLPSRERDVESVQNDGPAPRVYKVKAARVIEDTFAVAEDLQRRHATGTTAIIAPDREPIGRHFVSLGWRQSSSDRRVLEQTDKSLYLLSPESARGLEFDAVIVVEPGDFPQNLGRFGPLYTSLTRANRELAVVHSKPLPDGLRNQGMPAKANDL